jgi:preprotein translocase subunit SecA
MLIVQSPIRCFSPDHHETFEVKIPQVKEKSALVAVLPALKALNDQYVDVVTSSSVLAEKDANEYAPFL